MIIGGCKKGKKTNESDSKATGDFLLDRFFVHANNFNNKANFGNVRHPLVNELSKRKSNGRFSCFVR